MRRDYEQFSAKNTEIIAIGPDSSRKFQDFFQKNKLAFPGIPDPEHQISQLFAQEVNWLKLGRMPALILIDKNGTIQYVHYSQSMADIPDNMKILQLIKP